MPTPQEKAQLLLKIKKNPDMALLEAILGIDEKIKASIAQGIANMETQASRENTTMFNEAVNRAVENIIGKSKGDKGDPGKQGDPGRPGHTPVVGKDFFTKKDIDMMVDAVLDAVPEPKKGDKGDPGEVGSTPMAGVDFPTHKEIEVMVGKRFAEFFGAKEEMSVKEMSKFVESAMREMFSPATVARGLEKLKGEKKLSYTALKDRPNIPGTPIGTKKTNKQRGGGGGSGGSSVAAYDLSDELDGSTKSFTVPSNTNFLMLVSTQAPQVYRLTTDFTGSGTTTLTLTAEVDAPTKGQTLILLYVE